MEAEREDWRQRCEWCGKLLADNADFRKRYCDRICKRREYDDTIRRERAAIRAKLECKQCGKRIKDAKRKDRKYCSLICQWRYHAAVTERAAVRAKLRCKHCDKRIKNAKRAHRQYCCLRCEWRARYWRNHAASLAKNRAQYWRRRALKLRLARLTPHVESSRRHWPA